MSCEISYGLISNNMQTAITYLGTVLECALQNSCQAALEASFSQIFSLKDQSISPSLNIVNVLLLKVE